MSCPVLRDERGDMSCFRVDAEKLFFVIREGGKHTFLKPKPRGHLCIFPGLKLRTEFGAWAKLHGVWEAHQRWKLGPSPMFSSGSSSRTLQAERLFPQAKPIASRRTATPPLPPPLHQPPPWSSPHLHGSDPGLVSSPSRLKILSRSALRSKIRSKFLSQIRVYWFWLLMDCKVLFSF